VIAFGVAWASTYASHQVALDPCNIQDLLSVVTLCGGEHLQHCLQPIFSLKWISCMGGCWGWWLMNSRCLLSGTSCYTGGLLTWACKLAIVLVKFWRSWVCVWKNCCMAGSICPSCGARPEWLLPPLRFTAGWSTLDPDLVFTIWVLGTLF
jgi:hypothetical protein